MEQFLAHTHPVIIHFTMGLFVTGVLVDLVGHLVDHGPTRYAGGLMVVLGGILGLITMFTGSYAEESLEPVLSDAAYEVLEAHERWGGWAGYVLGAAGLARLLTFWLQNLWLRIAYGLLAAVGLVVLLITAHYGGGVTHGEHPHFIGDRQLQTPELRQFASLQEDSGG